MAEQTLDRDYLSEITGLDGAVQLTSRLLAGLVYTGWQTRFMESPARIRKLGAETAELRGRAAGDRDRIPTPMVQQVSWMIAEHAEAVTTGRTDMNSLVLIIDGDWVRAGVHDTETAPFVMVRGGYSRPTFVQLAIALATLKERMLAS
ncbi:hypothetical protein [Leifsonia sp. Leaf264]|uniref:hypothetical protein n=1 Tax=Leifsonia sp. Leaf264 TaxID=1736314 RepID=UPI0006F490B8|nr:hypothetical protein [Leifsonia sp. Leaf264]KQO98826.1 hypothetical protein ASF30_12245 [Leifsonia sp. Leaf264]